MGKATYCELTEEDMENLTEEELDNIPKCIDYNCFDCWGDRLSY